MSPPEYDVPESFRQNVRTVRGFEEPLLRDGASSEGEEVALEQAAESFERVQEVGGLVAFDEYLADYPDSPWRISILANMGLAYYRAGYFSAAVNYLGRAWSGGSGARSAAAKLLMDRAGAELAKMHARLGHAAELEQVFAEVGDRPVTGQAKEILAGARRGLWDMRNDSGVAFLCGPMALRSLLLHLGATTDETQHLSEYRSAPEGVNLSELSRLADQSHLPHALIYRPPGKLIPTPAVIHWKLDHYAAILEVRDDLYHVKDPTFGHELWLSSDAIEAESSGYFLIPTETVALGSDWRGVDAEESAGVWGRGVTTDGDPHATKPSDPKTLPCECGCDGGMAVYNYHETLVSLNVTDTPIGYVPRLGPVIQFTLSYNQREATQPSISTFSNLGANWGMSWLSYIVDAPNAPGYAVQRHVAGGGIVTYSGYDLIEGTFTRERDDRSLLVRVADGIYQRKISDGSFEEYSHADGGTGSLRKIFLSSVSDPSGNTATLNYDASLRLISVADAVGRETTLLYEDSRDDTLVTSITDPFGRKATIEYVFRSDETPTGVQGDGNIIRPGSPAGATAGSQGTANAPVHPGSQSHLPPSDPTIWRITDVGGLQSVFQYFPVQPPSATTPIYSAGLMRTLTTPYGVTTFAYAEDPNHTRSVETTDPLGHTERLEFRNQAPGIPPHLGQYAAQPGLVPAFAVNDLMDDRNTFYWDRHVYPLAFADPHNPDYAQARINHWTHDSDMPTLTGTALESVKRPLEGRTWFKYSGQGPTWGVLYSGDFVKPTEIARLVDDGTWQQTTMAYTSTGRPESITDALGRQTIYTYDGSGVDLLRIEQAIPVNQRLMLVDMPNYTAHKMDFYRSSFDAGADYSYDAQGRIQSVRTALRNEVVETVYEPDGFGRVSHIVVRELDAGTLQQRTSRTVLGFGYDECDRVNLIETEAPRRLRTAVGVSPGDGISFHYDVYDRVETVRFSDESTRTYTWDKLDLVAATDQDGTTTRFEYDANRRLTATIDALGRRTAFEYYRNGVLKAVTNPAGNTTAWHIDIQSRVIAERRADGSQVVYEYAPVSGRLASTTDALGQVKTLSYHADGSLATVDFANTTEPTPSVQFEYDAVFPRLSRMTEGIGDTSWIYNPASYEGLNWTGGGLRLSEERGPFGNEDVATQLYDEQARLTQSTIGRYSLTAPSQFDALERLVAYSTPIGTFAQQFLRNTPMLTARQLNAISTTWTYDVNARLRRLLSIRTVGARGFGYDITPAGQATSTTELDTQPPKYWSYRYDDAGQLLSADALQSLVPLGPAYPEDKYRYTYDDAGNITTIRRGAKTTAITYNSVDEILTYDGIDFTYDANGCLTQDDRHTYHWDAEQRLVRIDYRAIGRHDGPHSTVMRYDGLGRRVSIIEKHGVESVETRLVWSGSRLVGALAVQNGANVPLSAYFEGGQANILNGGTGYEYRVFGPDRIGSVRDVLESPTGLRIATLDYDPYGLRTNGPINLSGTVAPDIAGGSNFGFAGMFFHAPSGLYLTRHRVYDPRTARWLSPDPIAVLRRGLNPYSYANNDPVNFRDQSGLLPECLKGWVTDWLEDKFKEAVRGISDMTKKLVDAYDDLQRWIHRLNIVYSIGSDLIDIWDALTSPRLGDSLDALKTATKQLPAPDDVKEVIEDSFTTMKDAPGGVPGAEQERYTGSRHPGDTLPAVVRQIDSNNPDYGAYPPP